jgi:hypothetical protein
MTTDNIGVSELDEGSVASVVDAAPTPCDGKLRTATVSVGNASGALGAGLNAYLACRGRESELDFMAVLS